MPESVVPGSVITVGWSGDLTSVNAAAAPTAANIDIAQMVRGDFGDVVDGEFVPDAGFGTISIVSDDPFTVRYDLAEPAWSDGIPLDAADLLLGWAGASGYFPAVTEDAENADAAEAPEIEKSDAPVPVLDEFARSIDVTFPQPMIDWQQAVSVPVPAHIVGKHAFGLDDPMQAKQAVIAAIRDDDRAALDEIAQAWNEAFTLPEDGELSPDLLLSSGAFQIAELDGDEAGQTIALTPNTGYRGLVTPNVARIEFVPQGDDPVAALGDRLDVVQVAPRVANHAAIGDLERKDFTVTPTHDGTMWALLIEPSGLFSQHDARAAFIRALPANALSAGGAGEWASAYPDTVSMVAAPGTRAYDIVSEDSGFTQTLGTPADDAALERENAGLADGTRVCVLYDRRSEFATGAFAAAREAAKEAGWRITDCGTDDYAGALEKSRWDAVIARVPIPESPAQIAAQWGSDASASITRQQDADRDALIEKLAHTTDIYEAREVRAQIEATIVRAAVALPIAANGRVTVTDRDVTGITPRNGALAPLTFGAVQWAVQ